MCRQSQETCKQVADGVYTNVFRHCAMVADEECLCQPAASAGMLWQPCPGLNVAHPGTDNCLHIIRGKQHAANLKAQGRKRCDGNF